MKNKVYLVREGYFHTNWEIGPNTKVFTTKKSLHDYMKETHGHGFSRSKKDCYDPDEEIYENQKEEYGYDVIESTIDISLENKKRIPTEGEVCKSFERFFKDHGMTGVRSVSKNEETGVICVNFDGGGKSSVLDYSPMIIEKKPSLITMIGAYYEKQK